MTRPDHTGVRIDTSRPHAARLYDYYLGGKDNYEVDRAAAAAVLEVFPGGRICAQTNRAFMHRAVRLLATSGIRQFLDIGTGIPTVPNLHQVAQRVAPECRIVYTDNDPLVMVHAQALLRSTPEGRTAYLQADVRDPESIVNSPELRETLDMSRPVALSLNALLHFVPDEYRPYEIVGALMDALPSGSHLMLSHGTADFDPRMWAEIVEIYAEGGIKCQMRSRAEVERFFDGLELLEPGVELPHRWRLGDEKPLPGLTDAVVSNYVGVGRKP